MPTKVLVLGIDGVSTALLRRWAADGKLPAIRSLMNRGTSAAVRGVDGFYIGSTWPSLYTGLNPANHGFYRIVQLESGSYDYFRPLDSPTGVGGIPFWKVASDAGQRVAVLDVPLSRVDPDLNGLQIVEWGGHDSVFGFNASSPEVARDVMSSVGAYPLPADCSGLRRAGADFEPLIQGLESAVRKRAKLALDFLGQENWDLFVQVFTESHCAGHQCWHLHDETHPAHDPQVAAEVGDPIARVYRAIDKAVAAIVEQAGDAHILLICSHGMGPYRGAQALLPEILFRLGVTVRPPTPEASTRSERREHPLLAAARVARRIMPPIVRKSLRPLRERIESRSAPGNPMRRLGADVSKSKCFPVPNGVPVGGIRLNIVDREPQGVLKRGEEVEAFCEELARDLCAIVDERTGGPLITAVHRTDALYEGARRDALPDLLVEWNGDTPTGSNALAGGRGSQIRATSPKIGTVEGTNRSRRTGEHYSEGMFIGVGPGVPIAEHQECVSIMDFHPTICSLLGLPELSVDGVLIPEFTAPRA